MNVTQLKTLDPSHEKAPWLEIVRDQVKSLRYGTVEIVVHDARVVEIKKSERVRFPSDGKAEALEQKSGYSA